MNEEQIELWYERQMNRLDAQLMNGSLTQEEYDEEARGLSMELNELYHAMRYPNCRF